MILCTGIGSSHAHIKARRLTHMSADVYSPKLRRMVWNPVRHGHYHHVHHVAPLPSPQFLSPTQSITVGRSRFVRLALRGRSGFSRLVRASRYSSFFAILASVASLLLPTSLAHTFTTPTAHFRHTAAAALRLPSSISGRPPRCTDPHHRRQWSSEGAC